MKSILIAGFLLLLNSVESWNPVGNHIKTKWSKQVVPDKVWREYPRPQLTRSGTTWANLNGLWDYAITADTAKEPSDYQGKILVPFPVESSLSGVMKALTQNEILWYKTHFNSSVASNEKQILHFGAVDYECHVFLNGHLVGDHKGGYNRFSFDITKYLVSNQNSLVVKVVDKTGGAQPIGKQRPNPGGIWYTSTSGIWQTVWTEKVPKTYITDLVITPDVDNESVDITVVTNDPLDKIKVEIMDKSKKVVASNANMNSNKMSKIKIHSPRLWSTVDPYLYDIHIKAGNDTVVSYVGLRKIEVKKDSKGINRFFLNGKPIFMLGPLDQGYWPDGIYTPPNEEAMIYDFNATKLIGFNTIRKHMKVESDRYYYWADQMGFLVWQDFPSSFGGVKDGTRNPTEAQQIELEMERMVKQLHNFPSIIIWTSFNEGWGQYDTERIVGLFKKWDPSRLINEASGWTDHHISNIEDHHSYPNSNWIPLNPNRVAVNGEYGGGGLLVKEHAWDTKNLFQYHGFNNSKDLQKFFIDRLATVRAHAIFGLGAAIYTQTTDVEREINGLITYDREMFKVDVDVVSKQIKKLYPSESVEDVILAAGHYSSEVEWNYTTKAPTGEWSHIDYNSIDWNKGKAGFGSHGTPDLTLRTEWKTPDIWLRKEFEISEAKLPKHPVLYIFYDDIAQVYINGKKLDTVFDPYQTAYSAHDIDLQLLKSGKNVIAIHCHQISGGQGIDAGIYEIKY